MSKPAAIAAQLVDIRNVGAHKSLKLTIHVPVEQAHLVTEAFGWPTMVDPVPIAIARLKQQQEETNTATIKPAPVSPPMRAPKNRLTTRAAILCHERLFQQFVCIKLGIKMSPDCTYSAAAAEYVRDFCKVTSRKELEPGTEAGNRWDLLESAYICWRDAPQFVEVAS